MFGQVGVSIIRLDTAKEILPGSSLKKLDRSNLEGKLYKKRSLEQHMYLLDSLGVESLVESSIWWQGIFGQCQLIGRKDHQADKLEVDHF